MKTRTILICISLLIFNTVLFAQTPEWDWATHAGGSGLDLGFNITIDADGNLYTTGRFEGTADFGSYTLISNGESDIFVAKMDADGNWIRASKAGGASSESGIKIKIDSAGNSFITGSFEGIATFGSSTLYSSGMEDIYVAKLDADGNWLWATQVGGDNVDIGNAITIDDAGNCYVTGSFRSNSVNFGSYTLTNSNVGDLHSDIFVAKINANGYWQWAAQAGGIQGEVTTGIAIDGVGNLYMTGYFTHTAEFGYFSLTSAGWEDIFVAKMDVNGNWLWVTQATGTNEDEGLEIVIDDSGNSYVTGTFKSNTINFGPYTLTSSGSYVYDIFVAKVNVNGNWQWATQAGGAIHDKGYGITIDNAGNNYVTGRFMSNATFGSYSLTSSGDYDIFIAKMDVNGNWQQATRAGGNGGDAGKSITIDNTENCYVIGNYCETANFGTHSITSNGDSDIFVAKFSYNYDITFNSLADMITARSGFAYANDGDYLYAIAGANHDLPNDRINNIEKYDSATNSWSEFADGLIPRLYCRAEYIQSTDNIYIFGGLAGNNATHSDTVEVVDVNTGNLTYLTADHILSSQSGSAVWNNKIYIFGGTQNTGYSNELYEFEPSGNNWTQLADMPESKETEGEIVDGILYVFGGYNGSVSNRIDAYNIQNNEWSFIGYMPTGVSAHHTTASGQYIWLTGSYSDLNFVAEFNTATHEFTQLSNNMIGRRHCGTEVIGDNLYVYGGYIPGNDLSSLQYADISNVDIDDEPNIIPSPITLFQNYPNPFYPKTTISFCIKQNSDIELEIFNIKGQKIKTLINEFMQTGNHSIIWNGDDEYGKHVCSGLYFYKLSANGKTEVIKKCLLVK
ncbi:MAG: SBBP repeat-containing protein [Candidatus Cloacimonetes bacterium]|nr:SBBP repeat-containing protein [Candidatus Cloacimonadota bacterium]